MVIEGSGSISLTSGSGSGRPKNMWIRWIRIRNTAGEKENIVRFNILNKWLTSLHCWRLTKEQKAWSVFSESGSTTLEETSRKKARRSRMFFPDLDFFQSRIQGQKGTGTRIWIPSNELTKHLSIFNPKFCYQDIGNMIRISRIRIFFHPWSRGQKSTGYRIRTGDNRRQRKEEEGGGSIQCTQ